MVVLLLLMLFVSFIENMLVFECCIERGVEKQCGDVVGCEEWVEWNWFFEVYVVVLGCDEFDDCVGYCCEQYDLWQCGLVYLCVECGKQFQVVEIDVFDVVQLFEQLVD